jgi:hypothetical protein
MDSNGADSNGAVVDVVPDIAVDAVLDLDEAEEALISARTAPDDELQLLPAGDASPPPNAVDQPWVGDDAPAKGSSESNRAKPDSSEGKYGVDDLDDTFNNKRPVVPAGACSRYFPPAKPQQMSHTSTRKHTLALSSERSLRLSQAARRSGCSCSCVAFPSSTAWAGVTRCGIYSTRSRRRAPPAAAAAR